MGSIYRTCKANLGENGEKPTGQPNKASKCKFPLSHLPRVGNPAQPWAGVTDDVFIAFLQL